MVTEMALYSALRCVFGIWQNNEKLLISNGLRFIVTCLLTVALWVLFHVARHTFGTTITLANNVPLQDVSVMLGHASTRMTQHYARVMNASLKKSMIHVKEQLTQ